MFNYINNFYHPYPLQNCISKCCPSPPSEPPPLIGPFNRPFSSTRNLLPQSCAYPWFPPHHAGSLEPPPSCSNVYRDWLYPPLLSSPSPYRSTLSMASSPSLCAIDSIYANNHAGHLRHHEEKNEKPTPVSRSISESMSSDSCKKESAEIVHYWKPSIALPASLPSSSISSSPSTSTVTYPISSRFTAISSSSSSTPAAAAIPITSAPSTSSSSREAPVLTVSSSIHDRSASLINRNARCNGEKKDDTKSVTVNLARNLPNRDDMVKNEFVPSVKKYSTTCEVIPIQQKDEGMIKASSSDMFSHHHLTLSSTSLTPPEDRDTHKSHHHLNSHSKHLSSHKDSKAAVVIECGSAIIRDNQQKKNHHYHPFLTSTDRGDTSVTIRKASEFNEKELSDSMKTNFLPTHEISTLDDLNAKSSCSNDQSSTSSSTNLLLTKKSSSTSEINNNSVHLIPVSSNSIAKDHGSGLTSTCEKIWNPEVEEVNIGRNKRSTSKTKDLKTDTEPSSCGGIKSACSDGESPAKKAKTSETMSASDEKRSKQQTQPPQSASSSQSQADKNVIKQLKEYKIMHKDTPRYYLLERPKVPKETKTIEVQCDGPDWTPIVLPNQFRKALKNLTTSSSRNKRVNESSSLPSSSSPSSTPANDMNKAKSLRRRRKSKAEEASSSVRNIKSVLNSPSLTAPTTSCPSSSCSVDDQQQPIAAATNPSRNLSGISNVTTRSSTTDTVANGKKHCMKCSGKNSASCKHRNCEQAKSILNHQNLSETGEISRKESEHLEANAVGSKCKKKRSSTECGNEMLGKSCKKRKKKTDSLCSSSNDKTSAECASSATSTPTSTPLTPKTSDRNVSTSTTSATSAAVPKKKSGSTVRRRRFRSGLDMIRTPNRKRKPKLGNGSNTNCSGARRSTTTIDSDLKSTSNRISDLDGQQILTGSDGVSRLPTELKKIMVNRALGETILHRVARQGNMNMVLYCLTNNSCDVSARDNAGYTPLHECCAKGHLEIARALLEHGADVDASATGGIRPIHDAVESDNIEVVRLLLSYGSDVNIATYSGLTPLKLARSKGLIEFLRGFISDLTGEVPTSADPERAIIPWKFSGSVCFMDLKRTGYSIFDENDPVPCDDDSEECDEMLIEVSAVPHLPTYRVRCDESNGKISLHDSYLRLTDLLTAIKCTKDEFNIQHKDIQILCLSSHNIESNVISSIHSSTHQQVHSKSSTGISNGFVDVVKLDDDIRSILGIETVKIR